jgi:hypothetical protein
MQLNISKGKGNIAALTDGVRQITVGASVLAEAHQLFVLRQQLYRV